MKRKLEDLILDNENEIKKRKIQNNLNELINNNNLNTNNNLIIINKNNIIESNNETEKVTFSILPNEILFKIFVEYQIKIPIIITKSFYYYFKNSILYKIKTDNLGKNDIIKMRLSNVSHYFNNFQLKSFFNFLDEKQKPKIFDRMIINGLFNKILSKITYNESFLKKFLDADNDKKYSLLLKEIFSKALEKKNLKIDFEKNFKKFKKDFLNKKFYENLYLNNLLIFEKIPKKYLSEIICLKFIYRKSANFKLIPKECLTDNIVFTAINQSNNFKIYTNDSKIFKL
jgi:hypothetical protein